MELYHVTPIKNLPSIMENGLIPLIGVRSQEIGELEPRIFFFPNVDEMENALMNWLGESFDILESTIGEIITLSYLKITLPDHYSITFADDVDYECFSTDIIPPEFISVFGGE